jgi:general secretion pathway protein N
VRAASQRRLTPVLALAAAVPGALLMVLLFGAGTGVHWNPPRPTAPLPPARDGAALPAPHPLKQYALVWQKPLFSPDRHPTARAADGSSLGDLELTGVIITPTLRMALLRQKKCDTELQIREGAGLPDGSWTLAEVRPRAALFDTPSGRIELKLPSGAPITEPKADAPHAAPGAAEMRQLPGGGASAGPEEPHNPAAAVSPVMPADGSQRMGLGPQRSREQRPRQSQAALQAERLRQLKADIQKRRAEQAASAQEGAH